MENKKCCFNCQWYYEDELILEDDFIIIGFCENPKKYQEKRNIKGHIQVSREYKCKNFKAI